MLPMNNGSAIVYTINICHLLNDKPMENKPLRPVIKSINQSLKVK